MDLKQKYDVIAKKHKLPLFDEVNSQFDIDCVDEDFFLKEIKKKIIDRLDDYLKILESLLRPELIIVDLHESKEFSEDDRDKIWFLYRRFMFFNRSSFEVDLNSSDDKIILFLKSFFDEWVSLKKDLSYIVVKVKDSWLKDVELDHDGGYVG